MPHPLDGIWGKIRRAEELTLSLKGEIEVFVKGGNYSVKHVVCEDHAFHKLLAIGPSPPVRFGVLAGEVIHHYRSSLDHLVWQLVLTNNGKPSEKHAFPHCTTPQKFKEACRRKILDGISPEALKLIEESQPYHCQSGYESSRNWVLHDLDRIDKHRLLVVISAYATTMQLKVGYRAETTSPTTTPTIVRLKKPERLVKASLTGEEIFRVELKEPDSNLILSADPIVIVAFENFGPAQSQPVIPCLNQLRDGVVGTIQKFVPLLRAAASPKT